jgi:hypothetical protein
VTSYRLNFSHPVSGIDYLLADFKHCVLLVNDCSLLRFELSRMLIAGKDN